MTSKPVNSTSRKVVLQLLAGGVVGALVSLGLASLLPDLKESVEPGAAALLAIGLIFALMGLFVGLGVAIPGIGTNVLNVADREDLADQRAILTGSAVCCIALGLAMALLALSGPEGPVSGLLAFWALAGSFVLATAITAFQWRLYDELMRGVSLEASAWMAGIAFPGITLWAALAHIGKAAPIDPLGLIAAMAGSMLLGSFLVTGRRGLLVPR